MSADVCRVLPETVRDVSDVASCLQSVLPEIVRTFYWLSLQDVDTAQAPPAQRKVGDDVFKVWWRSEHQLRMLCLRRNKAQVLQLSAAAAAHERAVPWMLQILSQMPLDKEVLLAKKAVFLKDPCGDAMQRRFGVLVCCHASQRNHLCIHVVLASRDLAMQCALAMIHIEN